MPLGGPIRRRAHIQWHNPWASRQPLSRCRRFTADFSCVSRCGVGKDLDLGMIWGPKPRNFFSAVPVHKEQLWDWAFMRLNCASCLASYLKCPSTPSRNIPSCDCLLIRCPLVLPLCWAGEQWLIGKVHWDQEPMCLQHLRFPNSSWCPALVAWSSIPRWWKKCSKS